MMTMTMFTDTITAPAVAAMIATLSPLSDEADASEFAEPSASVFVLVLVLVALAAEVAVVDVVVVLYANDDVSAVRLGQLPRMCSLGSYLFSPLSRQSAL